MPKTRYNFSIDDASLDALKQLAEWDNRPVSNYLENLIRREFTTQSTVFSAGMQYARNIFTKGNDLAGTTSDSDTGLSNPPAE